jgi:transposase
VTLLERTLDNIDVQPPDGRKRPPQPQRLVCDKG